MSVVTTPLKLYTHHIAAIDEPRIDPTAKWVKWLISEAVVAKVTTIAVWLAYATGQHPTITS